MDACIIPVLLLCLVLFGCTATGGQPAANATPANGTAGNGVFEKLVGNIDANRFSDYKAEAEAQVVLSTGGVPLANVTVSSWANVSGRDGHAVFYATLSMPNGTGPLPATETREYYLADGRVFGQTNGNWTERSLPAGFPDAFNSQTELAVSSIDPASLQTAGEEDVDGVPCYVLQGPWNPEQEIAFASSMAGARIQSTINSSDIEPIEGNVTLWVSRDSYALMKHERHAGVMIGNSTRIDVSETMAYYDQNVTNEIDLPIPVIESTYGQRPIEPA